VPVGDPAALGEALREMLADPGALELMSERAREAALGEYSWQRVAARTLALYEELSAGPRYQGLS
jgi:glycosyltransferase involved in cell wall biosynthesis